MSLLRRPALLAMLALGWGLVGCTDPDLDLNRAADASRPFVDESSTTVGAPSYARSAPNVVGKTLEGERFDFSALNGQVVVLNFWATWCAPCRVEIPDLIALHEEWKEQGVRVVGVSVDRGGESVVRRFVDELGVTYPIVLDPEMEIARAYGGHYAFPTTFVIDREGRIRQRFMRVVGPDDLRPVLTPLR